MRTLTLIRYPGPCLLDIRRVVTSVATLYKSNSIGVDAHDKIPFQVPFYNTVNESGGYREECCIMPSAAMFLPGPVAVFNTGMLQFVPTVTNASGVVEGFVDQSGMVYNPAMASN